MIRLHSRNQVDGACRKCILCLLHDLAENKLHLLCILCDINIPVKLEG